MWHLANRSWCCAFRRLIHYTISRPFGARKYGAAGQAHFLLAFGCDIWQTGIMKTINSMLCAALALVIGGCDDTKSSSASYTPDWSKPLVCEDSIFALGVAPGEAFVNAKQGLVDLVGEDAAADMLAGAPANFKDALPGEVRGYCEKAGIDPDEVKWVVLTSAMPDFPKAGRPPKTVPDIAIAVRLDHDFAKLADVLKSLPTSDGESLEDATIAGCACLEIKDVTGKLESKGASPVIGSLDGKVLLFGSTKAAFEKNAALYLEGKGESADFKDFAVEGVALRVTEIDRLVAAAVPEGEIPEEYAALARSKSLDFACAGNKTVVTVNAASESDAGAIAGLAAGGLQFVKLLAGGAAQDMPAGVNKAIDGVEIKPEGDEVKITVPVRGELLVAAAVAGAADGIHRAVGRARFAAPAPKAGDFPAVGDDADEIPSLEDIRDLSEDAPNATFDDEYE